MSEPYWVPLSGASIQPPVPAMIELRNPQSAANPGNAFPTSEALTAWEMWRWEFVKDVDGRVYGIVRVPPNFTAPKIRLVMAWNAVAGVARLSVATAAVAPGASLNPAVLTAGVKDVAVPGTAYQRKDVDFTLASVPNEGDILIVSVLHEGSHPNDTVAVNSILLAALLLPA